MALSRYGQEFGVIIPADRLREHTCLLAALRGQQGRSALTATLSSFSPSTRDINRVSVRSFDTLVFLPSGVDFITQRRKDARSDESGPKRCAARSANSQVFFCFTSTGGEPLVMMKTCHFLRNVNTKRRQRAANWQLFCHRCRAKLTLS